MKEKSKETRRERKNIKGVSRPTLTSGHGREGESEVRTEGLREEVFVGKNPTVPYTMPRLHVGALLKVFFPLLLLTPFRSLKKMLG